MSKQLEQLHAIRTKLVEEIRDYVHSQKEQWRRVPWLALQADGRSGYSGTYAFAYLFGFWQINNVDIDCATGEIVSLNRGLHLTYVRADDSKVASLASVLDELVANRVIRDLQEAATRLTTIITAELERRESWRQGLLKNLDLSPLYVRNEAHLRYVSFPEWP